MQALIQSYTTPPVHRDHVHGRLLEEIAWLEARLLGMGYTGDCAYEKKLARSYQDLLQARRQELASSRSLTPMGTTHFMQTSSRYLFTS